ncbi:MAG: HAD hydrolase-like protein [Spirochaetales bacterium]|nr:HAD hydrolase-like protein [Spirochaetales bacterium]
MSPVPTDLLPKLNKPEGIRALLLDIYGTILISGTGDIGIAEEKKNNYPVSGILEEEGFTFLCDKNAADERFSELIMSLIKDDHNKKRSLGIQYPEVDIRDIWKQLLEILIDENYIDGLIDDLKIGRTSLSYECIINPVWPMPGADELIHFLYRSKLKAGIVSNAQFYTEPILKTLLDFRIGDGFFPRELIFYSFEQDRAKPSEEFFSSAVFKLKRLYNIDSHEILYVGNDMLNDIYTASKCGCRTALFAGDKRSLRLRASDRRCRSLEPDLILTHLSQLTEII